MTLMIPSICLRSASGPQFYVKSTCGSNRQWIYTAASYVIMNRPKNWLFNSLHAFIIKSKLWKVNAFSDWEWISTGPVSTIHLVPRQRMYGIQNRVDGLQTKTSHNCANSEVLGKTHCYESPACMKGYNRKIRGPILVYLSIPTEYINWSNFGLHYLARYLS